MSVRGADAVEPWLYGPGNRYKASQPRDDKPSEPPILDGGLARIVVEAQPRLTSVPTGREHLAQGRRSCEPALAELVEHHVADRAERVETHDVSERQRSHRAYRAPAGG